MQPLKQGDIIIANSNPTKGREQHGKRPALVISNNDYNKRTGLIIISPISNTSNNFPLHLPLPPNLKTTGSVLAQHIRTIDPTEREVSVVEQLPADSLQHILHVINLVFNG